MRGPPCEGLEVSIGAHDTACHSARHKVGAQPVQEWATGHPALSPREMIPPGRNDPPQNHLKGEKVKMNNTLVTAKRSENSRWHTVGT